MAPASFLNFTKWLEPADGFSEILGRWSLLWGLATPAEIGEWDPAGAVARQRFDRGWCARKIEEIGKREERCGSFWLLRGDLAASVTISLKGIPRLEGRALDQAALLWQEPSERSRLEEAVRNGVVDFARIGTEILGERGALYCVGKVCRIRQLAELYKESRGEAQRSFGELLENLRRTVAPAPGETRMTRLPNLPALRLFLGGCDEVVLGAFGHEGLDRHLQTVGISSARWLGAGTGILARLSLERTWC